MMLMSLFIIFALLFALMALNNDEAAEGKLKDFKRSPVQYCIFEKLQGDTWTYNKH